MTGREQPAALLLACLALVGCQDPYTQGATTAEDSPRRYERRQAERPRGDELPPPAPSATAAVPGFDEPSAPRSARTVLEAFCSQWANWSWRTIDRQQARLARLATGALADQLAAQARQARLDRTLRRDRLAMRGRLVAVDVAPPGAPGRAVCVTREQEVRNGRGELAGGRHRVYLATLERTTQGWGVSGWQPQP
jgi:hypothetical protein